MKSMRETCRLCNHTLRVADRRIHCVNCKAQFCTNLTAACAKFFRTADRCRARAAVPQLLSNNIYIHREVCRVCTPAIGSDPSHHDVIRRVLRLADYRHFKDAVLDCREAKARASGRKRRISVLERRAEVAVLSTAERAELVSLQATEASAAAKLSGSESESGSEATSGSESEVESESETEAKSAQGGLNHQAEESTGIATNTDTESEPDSESEPGAQSPGRGQKRPASPRDDDPAAAPANGTETATAVKDSANGKDEEGEHQASKKPRLESTESHRMEAADATEAQTACATAAAASEQMKS